MSNESVPIGNVIHVGLTSGMKSDPISEIAEYKNYIFKEHHLNLGDIFFAFFHFYRKNKYIL